MKSINPRLSQIALKDWLAYHPYNSAAPSDHFYMTLSNDIQHEMLLIDVEDLLVGADYKHLACMLTCFFEDMISQTGIWTSFTNEHYKLYGKYLPFYDMERYDHDDVNLADLQFLIWHFCSNLSVHSHFVDPFSIEITEIAQLVYSMMNEEVEDAPVNEDLKKSLIVPFDINIAELTKILDFFFFGCYLNNYYTTTLLQEEILHVKNLNGTQEDINDRRVHLLFNRVSPLLAQRSNEMLAHWLGDQHPRYQNLLSLSKRKEGNFLYEGATDTHLRMKHIASGMMIDLIKPVFLFQLEKGKTMVRMGIVQWGGEWYATAPVFQVIDQEDMNIAESEKYLFEQKAVQLGIIRREEECFLETSQNNRIVILESKSDAFTFIDNIWEIYHTRFGKDSMDRKMFEVHDVTFNIDDELENMVIFFNSNSGMEFYSDIAQSINMKLDNPFFEIYSETNIEDFILNERISSDFIFFLINRKMIEIESLTGKSGYHYVWLNCDFLLRYWKKEKYVSEPKLFVSI